MSTRPLVYNEFTEAHRERFHAASLAHGRGGAEEITCGARTRTGKICDEKPVAGSRRCIRHCGPHHANALHERRRQEYLAGKISHEEWTAAEGKRAANRIRDRWKKKPWEAGATLDLGRHEAAFMLIAGLRWRAHHTLPSLALDRLRWAYRRYQLDRRDEEKWDAKLREFRHWCEDAGPAPDDAITVISCRFQKTSFKSISIKSRGT